jgi:hypothetical protein
MVIAKLMYSGGADEADSLALSLVAKFSSSVRMDMVNQMHDDDYLENTTTWPSNCLVTGKSYKNN